MRTKTLSLYAPLDGTTVPLSTVPDEVFAKGLVGAGIAIAPKSSILKAPCKGEVINIHPSHHALTLRTKEGVDVLLHIGLDTVEFKGKGFHLKTELAATVEIGDELIAFDFSYLETRAKSILTEIVVSPANSAQTLTTHPRENLTVTAGEDIIMNIEINDSSSKNSETKKEPAEKEPIEKTTENQSVSDPFTSWQIEITDPVGLHARPAATIAAAAKTYHSDLKIIKADGKAANAKSVTDMMSLGLAPHDKIRLSAAGDDAKDALYYLTPLIDKTLSEQKQEVKEIAAAKTEAPLKPTLVSDEPPAPVNPDIITGTPASDGLAVGLTKVWIKDETSATLKETASDARAEIIALKDALDAASRELKTLYKNMKDEKTAAIFAAHAEILSDPALIDRSFQLIDEGKSAAFAWHSATSDEIARLAKVDNTALAARAADIKDAATRVLKILTHAEESTTPTLAQNTILLADELTPSDTVALDKSKLRGIATTSGSPTSHMAILAKTYGIPAIVGIEKRALSLPDNTEVLLDGTTGELKINLSQDELLAAENHIKEDEQTRTAALKNAHHPAITKDKKTIEVSANIGGEADAKLALTNGADGIGLLRSEFMFMDRETPPSEDEQTKVYTHIAKLFGTEKKLIIRTLDIGGDKPVPYLNSAPENNPFLGIRGIRLTLANPDLLTVQIRAILRASKYGNIHIMFPMISRIKEFLAAKEIVTTEMKKVKGARVKIGVMIEVPAAALIAETLATEADFFSIGTNDLTQYTLAMDRGNPDLNKIADAMHPAVLKLIKLTTDGAHKHKKWVGVCGGLAGVKDAVPVLLGLGIDELSVAPPLLPLIKETVRATDTKKWQKIAGELLTLPSATAVKEKLQQTITRKD